MRDWTIGHASTVRRVLLLRHARQLPLKVDVYIILVGRRRTKLVVLAHVERPQSLAGHLENVGLDGLIDREERVRRKGRAGVRGCAQAFIVPYCTLMVDP